MSLSAYHLLDDSNNVSSGLAPSASFALQPAGEKRVHAQSIGGESTFGTKFDESPSAGMPLPVHLNREDVIRSARHFKKLKPISPSRIRWNLVWLVFIWIVVAFPIYAPYLFGCVGAWYGVFGTLSFFVMVWFFAIFFTSYYVIYLYYGMNKDYKLQYSPQEQLLHIIVLTIYKDDMEVVMRTVSSIAKQTEAKRIVMLLAWEGRTPDRAARTAQMKAAFSNSFHMLLFSVHPFQLPHEIASKAANANWGLRYAVRHLFERVGHKDINNFVVSTCDSDTLFHERYFESLSAAYLKMRNGNDPETHHTIFQAPLFYNWNLDQSSFITRITGLLRTTMTMGCLIPYSVNPMSCFSFSLPLAIRGGYWHPQIFMDDVGYLLTMQIGVQHRVQIKCLPVPVLSGPTSGATWLLDMKEWYVQVRRWAIGTADNFHFMCVKMSNLPFVAAVTFTAGYFLYYGIILCAGPLFSLNSTFTTVICPNDSPHWGSSLDWLSHLRIGSHVVTPSSALFILSLLPYIFYAGMFLLDSLWIRIILHMTENISIPRNFLHWILVGPSMIAYSLVQLHGYTVLAFKGKVGACIHQLAGKASLGTGQGIGGQPSIAGSLNTNQDSDISSRMADEVFEHEQMDGAENGQTK